jgi:hypothetical protein
MNIWLRRLRGAIGMGVVWGVGGALVGGVMEFIANFVPGLNSVDMWIPLLAIPGAFTGAVFSLVLGIAARSRKFEELSLAQFTTWGALTGLILGTLLNAGGIGPDANLVVRAIAFGAPTLFGATAAFSTLSIAKIGAKPLPAGAGDDAQLGDGP